MTGTASPPRLPRIAVLGAGHVGPVIARVAIDAGYQVSIATSGDPDRIALITQVLAPGAEPRWAADAVHDADLVVLAIPLHRFAAFDSEAYRVIQSAISRDYDTVTTPMMGPGATDMSQVRAKGEQCYGIGTTRNGNDRSAPPGCAKQARALHVLEKPLRKRVRPGHVS